MRKSFLLTLLAVFLPLTVSADFPLKLGIRGGMNVTNVSVDKEALSVGSGNGFFVGPIIHLRLPLIGLGVETAVLYDQRKVNVTEPETDLLIKTVSVPLHLRFDFFSNWPVSCFVFAGPQFGFNLNDKEKVLDTAREWRVKDSTMSVDIGAGVTFLQRTQLSVNYNFTSGKTADVTFEGVREQLKSFDAKTNTWQIALTLYF